MLHPGNRKVLAYVRTHGDEVILCVANMSRVAQPVELELGAWKGRVPVEMLGRNAFPPLTDLPYMLTLPGHGFYWFRLSTDATPPRWHTERLPADDLAVMVLFDGWNSFFRQRVVPWRIGLAEKTRAQLEVELLPAFMRRQRWFHARGVAPGRVGVVDHGLLPGQPQDWMLALAEVAEPQGPARYFMPLALAFEDDDEERCRLLGGAAVGKVRQQAKMGFLADAVADEAFGQALVRAVAAGSELAADAGRLRFTPGRACAALVTEALQQPMPVHRVGLSTHSASLLGDRLFLKVFRRLQPGPSPALEVGRHLTDRIGFAHTVPLAGSLEYIGNDGSVWTLALLQAQLSHQGDAWADTVDQLTRLLESAAPAEAAPPVERFEALARRVAALHGALARRTGDPAFDPEPLQATDLQAWADTVNNHGADTFALLEGRLAELAPPLAQQARRLLAARAAFADVSVRAAHATPQGSKTRVHGHLRLEQVLLSRDDFVFIDFDGDTQRPLAARRAKQSAWRDVACLLASIDLARHAAVQRAAPAAADPDQLARRAHHWAERVCSAFLAAYRAELPAAGRSGANPEGATADALLQLYRLDENLHQLRQALAQHPEQIEPALAALADQAGLADESP
jgi:maltose alpha-D-glucosyltransferase/alpha-amylase